MSKDDKEQNEEQNRVVAGLEKTTDALAKAILDVVASVPKTTESFAATPRERARAIQTAASLKAAAVSGTLALPSGPLSFAVMYFHQRFKTLIMATMLPGRWRLGAVVAPRSWPARIAGERRLRAQEEQAEQEQAEKLRDTGDLGRHVARIIS